jgi:hypothetical protein
VDDLLAIEKINPYRWRCIDAQGRFRADNASPGFWEDDNQVI